MALLWRGGGVLASFHGAGRTREHQGGADEDKGAWASGTAGAIDRKVDDEWQAMTGQAGVRKFNYFLKH